MKNKLLSIMMLAAVMVPYIPIDQTVLLASELRTDIEISSIDHASVYEEHLQSTNELIDLFEINTNVDADISVDQSSVDYSTPGNYDIIITASYDGVVETKIVTLEIIDILPVINMESSNVSHHVGSDVDYINDYQIEATEFETGDLNDSLAIDDSQVDYNTVGTYPVYFKATDSDGNVESAEGTINFTNSAPYITADSNATTTEETVLSDDEIIELFNISAEDSDGIADITIDDSRVDYTTPGDYTIVLGASDIYGMESNVKYATLTVTDLKPTITLETSNASVKAGSEANYLSLFNPVATEVTIGDLTDIIVIDDSAVDLTVPGDYPVTFSVVDEEGNEVSETATITVEYYQPTITIEDNQTVKEEDVQSYYDLRDLFNVEYDVVGDSSLSIDDSSVDYNVPGNYSVTFTITDSYGGSDSVVGTLTVRDLLPTLSLETHLVIAHVGKVPDYIGDFEAVATEIESGDLTDSIVVDDSAVDIYTEGKYPITFSVTDNEGNTVSEDAEISLKNDVPIVSSLGEVTIDEGNVLSDDEIIELLEIEATDTDGVDSIIIDDSQVDYEHPGDYDVYFTATDIYGAVSNEHHAIIRVNDILPTLDREERLVFSHAGDSVNYVDEFGLTASEFNAGDLTSEIVIDDSSVEYDEVGPYTVVFSVSDNDGNTITKEGTLVITDDSPEIEALPEANTPESMELSDQDLLHLFEVKITDQDPIVDVRVDSSDIDYQTPGTYYVGFIATDKYGKDSTKYYSKLEVVDKLPEITTTVENVTIHVGDVIDYLAAFNAEGTELATGDITSDITIDSSNVDLNVQGTYPVIFSVSDNEGNIATLTVMLTVENDNPIIDTLKSVSVDEETILTELELTELYNVSVTDKDDIASVIIDDSEVDYSTPGKYGIRITARDIYDGVTSTDVELNVIDVLPMLTTQVDEVQIELGDEIDYIDDYGVNASEITDGDLTSIISIDDSEVDYSTPGEYKVVFTVSDNEDNQITYEVTLVINETKLTTVDGVSNIDNGTNQPSSVSELDIKSIEYNSSYAHKNILVNTGSRIVAVLIKVLLILIILLVIKKVYNTIKK